MLLDALIIHHVFAFQFRQIIICTESLKSLHNEQQMKNSPRNAKKTFFTYEIFALVFKSKNHHGSKRIARKFLPASHCSRTSLIPRYEKKRFCKGCGRNVR